ncbi:HEAT repeat domain-containing protein [Actinomadura sp. NAK00032]|uniref:HEAT repeat domain-containing protein n=1 Tax=Actinomadura sp. NAK00032 TaxID=2742128 RepID=UPI0015902E03|nr:HEAT repeat domain-containing protein [Actinomadura sp. NAK00032]QKW32858.1 HEAT repeat domain-containing protein [Actinomadura sp. NAK00032]
MFSGLHDIDWSSMEHAYGSAEEVPGLLLALRSPDAEEREKALSRFYGAVHHQGDVYPCTTASLPFLFELADDVTTPGRADVVGLLVSIGSQALDHCDGPYGGSEAQLAAVAAMRGRIETLIGFSRDPNVRVRRAAIPALGLFMDDVDRASAVLRGRLPAEPGVVEQLLIVEAMGALALRLPERAQVQAMTWFTELAADSAATPQTRLAAVVQRARCAPEQIGDDTIATAVGLLRELDAAAVPAEAWCDPPRPAGPAASGDGAPPQIAAAFEDLERHRQVFSPTTDLLRSFHWTLAARVSQRTTLLAEQLRSRDPGSRLDAIRMSADLMKSWRGDHARLVSLVAEHLSASHAQVAAEAAATLNACHAIAEPAREALAAHVAAQYATYGPDVWCTPQPHLRRSHQEAVQALARLGDPRALPSVLTALDTGDDAWRAVQVAGALPQAADQLVPRLGGHLRSLDLTQALWEMSARSDLAALAALADDSAIDVITETLAEAVAHELWSVTCSALEALRAFGPSAAPALRTARLLITASDAHVRPAAIAALWAITGDPDEVMRPLLGLLDDSIPFRISAAADVLAEIGPRAEEALPRLRGLLSHGYEWVRVPCATALWDIGGDAEAAAVLDTLLQAWAQNPSTADHAVACLDRMGPAARPALPQLRSELHHAQRRGRYNSIGNDEKLQEISRTLIGRLTAN